MWDAIECHRVMGKDIGHGCDGLPLAGSLSIYLRPLPLVIMRSMFRGYTGF